MHGSKFPLKQKHLKELVVAYRGNIAIDFYQKNGQIRKNG